MVNPASENTTARTSPTHSACDATDDLEALKVPSTTLPPMFKEFGIESFAPLDDEHVFRQVCEKFSDQQMTRTTPHFAELGKLFTVLDTTSTTFGKLALLRQILHPASTLVEAKQRQQAVRELMENPLLREQVQQFVDSFLEEPVTGLSRQQKMLRALGVHTPRPSPTLSERLALVFKRSLNSIYHSISLFTEYGDACKRATTITCAESSLLRQTLEMFVDATKHPAFPIISKGMCITWNGIYARGEVKPLLPVWTYTRRSVDIEQVIIALGSLAGFRTSMPYLEGNDFPAYALNGGFMGCFTLVMSRQVSAGLVRARARERLQQIDPFLRIIDAVGELDALLAIARFNERHTDSSAWPELVESDSYQLTATGLKAPYVHAKATCVANDITLFGTRPLIITGPNSAGKTTALSAITHNHILAQIGAKVIADSFRSSVVDLFLYQGPDSIALSAEGRFGMEMLETKQMFGRATRHSLMVLDEVAGGTSTEESREIAEWIVHDGLAEIGCGVLMVTHDHELARRLHALGKVECAKVDLEDDEPTYIIHPGVANSSRPDRVLRSIEFTREDMLRILEEKKRANA